MTEFDYELLLERVERLEAAMKFLTSQPGSPFSAAKQAGMIMGTERAIPHWPHPNDK